MFLHAVAMNYGEKDCDFNVAKMILAGIPLSEPCLQSRLSVMAESERKGLGRGRLPISESFYLMGTTDPTGILKSNEVCVILYVYFFPNIYYFRFPVKLMNETLIIKMTT